MCLWLFSLPRYCFGTFVYCVLWCAFFLLGIVNNILVSLERERERERRGGGRERERNMISISIYFIWMVHFVEIQSVLV